MEKKEKEKRKRKEKKNGPKYFTDFYFNKTR